MCLIRFLLCLLLLSVILKHSHGFDSDHHDNNTPTTIHLILTSSLLPSYSCKFPTKEIDKKSSLKVVHKHGPCAQPHTPEKAPTPTQTLLQDQSRVNSIHKRLSNKAKGLVEEIDAATKLPAKDGSSFGIGNFIVTVGIGTPKKELSLIFDTGSDLTWTQCEPCVKYCYNQKEQKFDPSLSASYYNISCATPLCNSLVSATGNSPKCASSTCVYGIQYGDSSYSVGFFSKEKLTLTPTDVFDNFYFGCGQNNRGLFGGTAGLLGLGRDKLSLVSQTASKYNKLFSYCLPSTSSSTGFLSFGGSPSKSAKFTPLMKIPASDSFYGLSITGITVGGRKLQIAASVFSVPGAIIDSGTVITRLPPAAYEALRTAFRQGMSKYPSAKALSILDTCYDLSGYSTITIPKIGIIFRGEVELDIDSTGILYANSLSQVCLAFAGNSDDGDTAVLGNVQQQTVEVVYDAGRGRIGFAPAACS